MTRALDSCTSGDAMNRTTAKRPAQRPIKRLPETRFIGKPGWVRSSAWVWLFLSSESTAVRRRIEQSTTTSRNLAANSGSPL